MAERTVVVRPGARARFITSAVITCALVAVVLVATTSAWGRGKATDTRFNGTISIGFITDLSGIYQTIGYPAYNGALVSVKQINDAGGIKIGGKRYNFKLVTCEANSDSAQAVACAQHLVRDDRLEYIMGGTGPESPPIASITDPAGVIFMNPGTALAQQLANFKWAFNPLAGINLKVQLAVKALVRTFPNAKNVAFVTANDPTAAVMPLIIQELAKYKINVVDQETYDISSLDVTPQLTRAKSFHPDLLFVGWTQTEAAPVIAANQAINAAPRIYGWTGGGSCEKFQPQLGATQFVSDLLIPVELASPSTPGAIAFANAYKTFVTSNPRAAQNPVNIQNIDYGANFADAINLLAHAMQKAGTYADDSKIAAAMMTTTVNGIGGPYKLAADRSAVIPQAQCSVNIKRGGVISYYIVKP